MAVKHLVPIDRFPLTLCGVDVTLKTGVDWVADDGEDDTTQVSCRNCLKLLSGGQMGAPPPKTKTKEERLAELDPREPFWERAEKVRQLRAKVKSVITDVRAMIQGSSSDAETGEWTAAAEFLEAGEFRLECVAGEIKEVIKALTPEPEGKEKEDE